MAVIKYQVKENKNLTPHSFFAQAVTYSTLTTDDLAPEVVEGMTMSPHEVAAIINRYADVVIREVQRGHRVKFGNAGTFYPSISASVKDEVDANGNVTKAATADMLNISNGKSTINCTVSQAVNEQFAREVQWKKITDKDDDDTTTDGGDGGNGSGTTTDTGSSTGSGDSASSSGNTSGDSTSSSASSKGGNE